MIKVKIDNWNLDDCKELFNIETKEFHEVKIIDYDEEKFKDGVIYEFNSLKDAKSLIDEAENSIDFTEEFSHTFGSWDWGEIDINLSISSDEDNMLILHIGYHREFRD